MALDLRFVFELFAVFFSTDADGVKRAWRYLREAGLAPVGQRGRGGRPAEVTPDAAFALLIGMLSTEARERTGDRATGYVTLRPKGGGRCGLTAALDFGRAGAQILSSPALAKRVQAISVTRAAGRASILYSVGRKTAVQEFVAPKSEPEPGFVRLEAVLDGDAVRDLAECFRDADDTDWTPTA